MRVLALLVWIGLAVACIVVFGVSFEAIVAAAGLAVLAVVTVTDIERRIVPNRIVLPALLTALLVQTARDPSVEWIAAAAVGGGFYLALALVYPAGLGMGDVKLAAFLGAWLGWEVVVALFLASMLALVPALAILLRRGTAGRKTALPYAPFMALGATIALFVGDRLLDAWLG